jgi:hypothetical protein
MININLSRRDVVLSSMAGAVVMQLLGCGGGAVVGALVPPFAPFFVFTFSGVVERKIVAVNFLTSQASSGKTSGSFDTSNISVAGQQFQFTGTFSERTLMITVAAPLPPLAAVYNGLFTEDETIVLTPVQPGRVPITVRLDRSDPPARRFLPALTGDWIGQAPNGAPWRLTLATDPVNAFPQVDLGDATVLLTGAETLGVAAAVNLLGYASVHYIELDIARTNGAVHLTGTLQASATPPAAGQSQTTATIAFNGGGFLHRVA